MAGMHRFWSFYEDASSSDAPTGVFIKRLNDCVSQVASSGANCVPKYDDSNASVGYVDESCHDGRVAGLDKLYNGEPYMAYDYYNNGDCTDYENSASYRASGDCETLYDDYHPVRSATISTLNGVLVWTRNMGPIGSALKCPGATGPEYVEFDVSIADINNNTCKNAFTGIDGEFVFYNMSAASTTDISSSDIGESGSTSTSGINPDSSASGSGLAIGAVVGIVAGIAVVLVAITAASCWLWKRSKRNDSNHQSGSMHHPFIIRGSAWTGGPTDDSESSTLGPGLWNDDAIIATRVPRDQVNVQSLICRGGFGEIYRGMYNREAVAIKMLFPEARSDLKKVNVLLAEAKIMAGLNHPHIVRFVGVSWGSLTDLCMLTELLEGGDLRALLKEFDAQGHPQGIDQDKLRIAYHVAMALTYLHSLSPIMVHRDLKSKNVLLTENLDAKLTDFGVSRERQEHTMTAGIGTMLWMAPEVMMAQHYDEKADIFSFGVLLSELDLQMLPYADVRVDPVMGKKAPDAVIIQKVVSGALQVSFSWGCLASVVQLGKECVSLDPSARPSAPMVVFRLQTIMKACFREGYLV
ncbi:hypothetical protein PR001_g26663 [Phytophthora rubi]|uniref:Protein kinase domain-containing protein n=1 Tax=Phytophthora rubi TaxID=129364 RepID=A0A6A3HRE2_9STRA|nr:hypothetical protein PR001_g26663 [Phytophthora rubi]